MKQNSNWKPGETTKFPGFNIPGGAAGSTLKTVPLIIVQALGSHPEVFPRDEIATVCGLLALIGGGGGGGG